MKFMMKIRFFFIMAALCAFSAVQAQGEQPVTATEIVKSEGVAFVEGKTFAEVLHKAKEEGKMLFIDCYTSWCGPCRMMATQVFPQKKVGDYFNEHFVSFKIDMEKGEGPELKNKFSVRAYPTFLFLDGDGKEINRIVGGDSDADKFLKSVDDGIGTLSLSSLAKRYEGGERDTTFLLSYLKALDGAYDSKKANEVAGVLLEGRDQDMLTNKGLFDAFLKYNTTPLSPAFQYVLSHKAIFTKKYGDEHLDRAIESVWMSYPRSFVTKESDGSVKVDDVAMEAYKKEMKKWKVKNADEVILNYDMYVAESKSDWKTFAALCTKNIKKYGEYDMSIYNWALRIQQHCKDPKVRETAIGWINARMKNIAKEKAKEMERQKNLEPGEIPAMTMMDFSQYYVKMIEDLKK